MNCLVYTISLEEKNKSIAPIITNEIEFKLAENGDQGFDLGYWAPKPDTAPGTALKPRVYPINNIKDAASTNVLETHLRPHTKSRLFSLVKEGSADVVTNMCLVYLAPANFNNSCRFLNNKELRTENKIVEGYVSENNVAPEVKLNKAGKKVFPKISRPAILCCYEEETYKFQYWDHLSKSLHEVSIHFSDGELTIDEDKIKSKKQVLKPKPAKPQGTLGMAFADQVPDYVNGRKQDRRRKKDKPRRDRYESRWN